MNSNLKYVLLSGLILCCAILQAQQKPLRSIPSLYELEHIQLNTKDDLGWFGDIAEDKEGYLWLSGSKGMYVFDGANTIAYVNGDPQFPVGPGSEKFILSKVLQSSSGNLFIQEASSGLIEFDPRHRKYVRKHHSWPQPGRELFAYMGIDSADNIYPVTNDVESHFIIISKPTKAGTFQVIHKEPLKLGDGFLYELAGNNHWIVSNGKFTRIALDGSQSESYSIPGKEKSAFYLAANGSAIYFLAVDQEGIYTWDEKENRIKLFQHLPDRIKGKVTQIFVQNDLVYIGSNLNLFILDRKNETLQDLSPQFTELVKKEAPNSLSDGFVRFFMCRDSTILLLTQANIYRIKKKLPSMRSFRQEVRTTKPDLSDVISFRGIAEDEDHNIYASYYTGISRKKYGDTAFMPLATTKYVDGEAISTFSLNYWKKRLLWNNVLIDLSNGHYKYLFGGTFAGHTSQYMLHDSVWLFKWNTDSLHVYDLHRGLTTNYLFDQRITAGNGKVAEINAMVEDESGQNLWVATTRQGLFLMSKQGRLLKQYSSKSLNIQENYITDLHREGDLLWFGCIDGLGVLNTKTEASRLFRNPFLYNGILQNRKFFSIVKDTAGNFYLGSNHGLVYFDTHSREFQNLPQEHPLANLEFNRSSALRTSQNTYYFGSTDGLYFFKPGQLDFIKSSNAIRPVKLYSISIFNTRENRYRFLSASLQGLKKLTLNPADNNIEFHFSVPEFNKRLYYSYRLKGQNDKWSEYRPENKILLYGLPPGNFVLQIKASTDLGDKNASYYSLPIKMTQLWYKKAWVIALLCFGVIAAFAGYFLYQFKEKLKRQQELERLRVKISSDLHDDVGAILSGLTMQSQMLSFTADEKTKQSLNEISHMGREAMEHMRDIVWAMDSRKDKFENLLDRMRAFAEKNLGMKNIAHEFVTENIDIRRFISPEKRQSIYLLFTEAITNIVKHSDGKLVNIKFQQQKSRFYLSIHDNGRKNPLSTSDGLGIGNMRMRAQRIGGQLDVRYEGGFRVELVFE